MYRKDSENLYTAYLSNDFGIGMSFATGLGGERWEVKDGKGRK
jgi:hypothetical protein